LRLIVVPVPVALFAALAIGAWAGAASPQTSTTTSTNKKKKSVTQAKAKTSTAKTPPVATKSLAKTAPKTAPATSAKRATTSKSKRPVAAARRPQQPSPERYKEIQQALAGRGYFHGEPDGTWGSASIESLKRFQHDQNLVEDGKIGSLSLIALGLGPKRESEPEQKTP
jgi:peptidoglycan hydrolase-like protein with peptidoglycan-binding domain